MEEHLGLKARPDMRPIRFLLRSHHSEFDSSGVKDGLQPSGGHCLAY